MSILYLIAVQIDLPTSRAQIFAQARSARGRFFYVFCGKSKRESDQLPEPNQTPHNQHQINSVQIWCKKLQIKVKSKAKMVNTAFAYKFTTPCKPVCKCSIYHLWLWFPPRLHFFAPYLHRANLCISRASASASSQIEITFSSPEQLGLICNHFPTTWPRNDGLWGRECKDQWKNISWIQCFDIELRYIVKRYWAVLCLVRHARLMVCLPVRASSFTIMLSQRLRRPYFYYCSLNLPVTYCVSNILP